MYSVTVQQQGSQGFKALMSYGFYCSCVATVTPYVLIMVCAGHLAAFTLNRIWVFYDIMQRASVYAPKQMSSLVEDKLPGEHQNENHLSVCMGKLG